MIEQNRTELITRIEWLFNWLVCCLPPHRSSVRIQIDWMHCTDSLPESCPIIPARHETKCLCMDSNLLIKSNTLGRQWIFTGKLKCHDKAHGLVLSGRTTNPQSRRNGQVETENDDFKEEQKKDGKEHGALQSLLRAQHSVFGSRCKTLYGWSRHTKPTESAKKQKM